MKFLNKKPKIKVISYLKETEVEFLHKNQKSINIIISKYWQV